MTDEIITATAKAIRAIKMQQEKANDNNET